MESTTLWLSTVSSVSCGSTRRRGSGPVSGSFTCHHSDDLSPFLLLLLLLLLLAVHCH